jgi:hypothetical protein
MSILVSESFHTTSQFCVKPRNISCVKYGRICPQIRYSRIPLVWHPWNLTGAEVSNIQICSAYADLSSHW